jgi:hypothetical protein
VALVPRPVYIACIWYEPFVGFSLEAALHVVCDLAHPSMRTMLQSCCLAQSPTALSLTGVLQTPVTYWTGCD